MAILYPEEETEQHRQVRYRMGDLGQLRFHPVKDEIQVPISIDTVTVLNRNIYAVTGVYLATDLDHALTNYYTGGSFQQHTGLITLGSNLPNALQEVIITYTYVEGVMTALIDVALDESEAEIKLHLCVDYDWEGLAVNAVANQARFALASLKCMWAMNFPNAVQMGYNYRIGDIEVQTKLWGEGMIAQDLFNQLRLHCRELLDLLRGNPHAVVTPDWTGDKYYWLEQYL